MEHSAVQMYAWAMCTRQSTVTDLQINIGFCLLTARPIRMRDVALLQHLERIEPSQAIGLCTPSAREAAAGRRKHNLLTSISSHAATYNRIVLQNL